MPTTPEPSASTPSSATSAASAAAGAPVSPASPTLLGHSPHIRQRAHYSLWLVWLVPLLAVGVGLWLGIHALLSRGPEITIGFQSAEGLEAGKTKIKYKNVDVGLIKAIRLTPDHNAVQVIAELEQSEGVEKLIASDTRFWVVRPQVDANGISGLGTLLSGAYIGLDIGRSSTTSNTFKGLEQPPMVTGDQTGRQFQLNAQSLGSLSVGAPIYFRHFQVGKIVSVALNESGKQVQFAVFIKAPYDRFVTNASRFWNTSGVDFSLDANGVRLTTESLASIVAGGIAFEDLSTEGDSVESTPAKENTVFTLHPDRSAALKQPDAWSHDYVMLFEGSVRGLSIGAPVEFRGLNIGEVKAIHITPDAKKKSAVPQIAVMVRVYPARLPRVAPMVNADEATDAGQMRILTPMIASGLRAQLRSGNLITGSLYVALDFFPHAQSARIDWTQRPALFPTVPASLDSLQENLASIVEKIDRLPLEKIAADLDATLVATQATLKHSDALVQNLNADVTPQLGKLLQNAQTSLTTLNQTLANVNQTIDPDNGSTLTTQTSNTLQELSKAAKSLRELSDYLQRHPETLLRAKPEDSAP